MLKLFIMSRLELNLFGYPEAYFKQEKLKFRGKQPLALFIYLALEDNFVNREVLAEILFCEGINLKERFRKRLAELTKSLRLAGCESVLIRKGNLLRFDNTLISLDVTIFKEKAALEDETALKLYKPLLDGFDFKSEGFNNWLANHKLSLHSQYTKLIFNLSKKALYEQNLTKALAFSKTLIEQDPLHEEAFLLNIEILSKLGQRYKVIEQYNLLKEQLDTELNLEPLPETQARVKDLLNQLETTTKIRTKNSREINKPFVGRKSDLGRLNESIEVGALIHIIGDSGIGKTRLLKEFSRQKEFKVVLSECVKNGQFPYGLWTSSLGINFLSVNNSYQIAEQIAKALIKILTSNQQFIWIIDDAQWATKESLEVLPYLIRRLADYPISFIVSSHGETQLQDKLDSFAIKVRKQTLLPITKQAMHKLLLSNQIPLDKETMFIDQAEGNPFILTEMLLAFIQGDNSKLPETVRASIISRYLQLPKITQRTAEVAAIIGREVPSALLQQLLSFSDERFAQACEELEDSSFFIATTDGFRFVHQKLPEAILTKTTKSRERLLHKRISKLLIKAGLAKNAEQILIHAKKALLWPEYYSAAIQAADASRRLGARDRAAHFESQALEVQDHLKRSNKFQIILRREDDYHTLGNRGLQLIDIETLEKISVSKSETTQALFKRGRYLRALGQLEGAEFALKEALDIDESRNYQMRLELAYILSERTHNKEAKEIAEAVYLSAVKNKDIDFQLESRFCLAFILNKQWKNGQAQLVLLEVEALARHSLVYQANFWKLLSVTQFRKNDADNLLLYSTKAYRAYKKLHDLKGQADALELRFIAAIHKFDIELAKDSLTSAQKIFRFLADEVQIAGCEINFGYLNEKLLKNHYKAIASYERALGIFTRLKLKRGLAHVNWNLSSYYSNLFEPKKAEYFAKLAIEQAVDIPGIKAHALTCLGNAQRLQKQYEKSLENYAKAEAIQNKFNFVDSSIRINYTLSFLSMGNLEKAIESLNMVKKDSPQEDLKKDHLFQAIKAYYYHCKADVKNQNKSLELAKIAFINEIKTLKKKEQSRIWKENNSAKFILFAEEGDWKHLELLQTI